MTVVLCALVLLTLFLIPFAIWQGQSSAFCDIFGPVRLVSALHVVTIIPFLLVAAVNPEVVSPLVRNHQSVRDLEYAIFLYTLVQAAAFIALMIGIRSPLGRRWASVAPIVGGHVTRARLNLAIALFLGIGLASFAGLVWVVGGVEFLLSNLHRRTSLTAGWGYLSNLVVVFSFAVLLLLYSWRYKTSLLKAALLFVLIGTTVLILSSFGGRKNTLHFAVLLLLTWHYGVRRIRKPQLIGLLIAGSFVPYILVMPLLRSQGGVERYRSDLSALARDARFEAEGLVTSISYVDHYVLIVNHFRAGNVWLGRSYLDVVTAPIPSSLFREKPPVDDGMYIRTLASGSDVSPPMSRGALYPSSWPPETLGAAYMNFWWPGVICAMYLLGIAYRTAYEYMRRSNFTLYSIVVYGVVLLNFHLSTLRIVQTSTRVLLMTVLFAGLFGARWHLKRANR